MKTILLLAFCALAATTFTLVESQRVSGENGWYVPQTDGSLVWQDMDVAEKNLERLQKEDRELSLTPVDYYLYTNSNPSKSQKITATTKSIDASYFNAANPTRFVIHGWTQSYTSGMNKEIRSAWLARGNYNVIVVDWARARSVDYATSVLAVSTVGEKVASMINFLASTYGMNLGTTFVIGHSLGAHVAGYTGKNVKNGQLHTIVGLDPALPLFLYNKPDKRLSSTDAHYVESIQTNGGTLGFLKPIGKGAFYPNGGETQPGCFLDVTGACSHGRSTTYYAEAVSVNNYGTIKCADYQNAVKNNCGSTYSSTRMGSDNNAYTVSGDFYVPVNSKTPFGMIN